MRFNSDMAIWEVCKEVSEKLSTGGADHGLFQAGSGTRKGRWFKPNITLKGAELLSGVRTHTYTHILPSEASHFVSCNPNPQTPVIRRCNVF